MSSRGGTENTEFIEADDLQTYMTAPPQKRLPQVCQVDRDKKDWLGGIESSLCLTHKCLRQQTYSIRLRALELVLEVHQPAIE